MNIDESTLEFIYLFRYESIIDVLKCFYSFFKAFLLLFLYFYRVIIIA